MNEIFCAGEKLSAVWYAGGENGYITEGPADSPWLAKSIVVQMEYGQMAMVPWAKVTDRDDNIVMVNLAQADCVVMPKDYKDKEEPSEDLPF